MRLNDYLTRRLAEGKRTLLVIDEAQNMDEGLLESIRMLSNLETSESKLLQIILAGQPELESMLALPGMRQLRQRVSLKAVIDPLSRAETEEYIRFRMEVAGLEGEIPFTRPALDLMYEYSWGLPRTVNVVADNALLIGFAAGDTEIGRDTVAEAVRDLERESSAPVSSESAASRGRGVLLGAAALVTIVAALLFGSGFFEWNRHTPAEKERPGNVGAALLPNRDGIQPAEPKHGERSGDPNLRADPHVDADKSPESPANSLMEPETGPSSPGRIADEEDGTVSDRPGPMDSTGASGVPPGTVPVPGARAPQTLKAGPVAAKPALPDVRTLRKSIVTHRVIPAVTPAPGDGAPENPGTEKVISDAGGEKLSPPRAEEPAGDNNVAKQALPPTINIPLIFAPPASSRTAEKEKRP
jgi:hypothetical protein